MGYEFGVDVINEMASLQYTDDTTGDPADLPAGTTVTFSSSGDLVTFAEQDPSGTPGLVIADIIPGTTPGHTDLSVAVTDGGGADVPTGTDPVTVLLETNKLSIVNPETPAPLPDTPEDNVDTSGGTIVPGPGPEPEGAWSGEPAGNTP